MAIIMKDRRLTAIELKVRENQYQRNGEFRLNTPAMTACTSHPIRVRAQHLRRFTRHQSNQWQGPIRMDTRAITEHIRHRIQVKVQGHHRFIPHRNDQWRRVITPDFKQDKLHTILR